MKQTYKITDYRICSYYDLRPSKAANCRYRAVNHVENQARLSSFVKGIKPIALKDYPIKLTIDVKGVYTVGALKDICEAVIYNLKSNSIIKKDGIPYIQEVHYKYTKDYEYDCIVTMESI